LRGGEVGVEPAAAPLRHYSVISACDQWISGARGGFGTRPEVPALHAGFAHVVAACEVRSKCMHAVCGVFFVVFSDVTGLLDQQLRMTRIKCHWLWPLESGMVWREHMIVIALAPILMYFWWWRGMKHNAFNLS